MTAVQSLVHSVEASPVNKKLMASELEVGLECGKSDREIGTLDQRFALDSEGSRMYETER